MSESLVFKTIFDNGWQDVTFEPFQTGVEICWLTRGKPEVALLRYEPGASVPKHRHTGMETILVLEGSQSDESGRYVRGTYIINPAGTEHSVWTEDGCLVLIQWEAPVAFLSQQESSAETQ